ncbi:hypothetical protein [Tsukamurella sp. NPDC003166]|uniref:hypothetical protein n=1 Tax=Tsukamurella sp. NPDC003166 TaxID=3154444 RepID=UPI0033B20206
MMLLLRCIGLDDVEAPALHRSRDPRGEVPFASITAAGAALAEKVAGESTERPAQE